MAAIKGVIEGVVERVVYRNEETLYAVAKVQCRDNDDLTTVVGTFAFVGVGETLRMKGEWVSHPDYGKQFRVVEYETVAPATLNAIERYLGSGLIKGIGPVTAKKLVDRFGLDTLDVIEKEPDRLTELEGIGPKKSAAISRAFQEQKEIQRVMVFLAGHGVSPTYAVKIYKHYGDAAIQVVVKNPYRLAEDIYGIGFKTADKIAKEVGIDPTSPGRISAGVEYVLSEASNDGHVYLPKEKLVEEAVRMLEVPADLVFTALPVLEEKASVFVEDLPSSRNCEGARRASVYLSPFYYAETGAAARLLGVGKSSIRPLKVDLGKELMKLERESGVKFAANQKLAIRKAVETGFLVLTGGPGTGKTTTLRGIIRLLESQGLKVALGAPTGRAAKRLYEATGRHAKTIHRLLEFGLVQGEMRFQRNEERPLDADVVVIDEVSMVDLLLMYNLLKAIRLGTRLILVGDVDQLPSVGPGNVLRDIIDSGVVDVVILDEIFRQARESTIVVNAHRVNNGQFPFLGKNNRDFFFIQEEDPAKVVEIVTGLVTERLPAYLGCDPVDDIQVLTPMRRTITGVDNLNITLRDALNPEAPWKLDIKYGPVIFRVGDKVMQIRNDYEKMVFNGDIGRVISIDTEEREMVVAFPEADGPREVTYEQHELDELVLSYAVSIHKSQGSEYPAVVMPLTTQHYVMLQRNLLYTGITRAKKMVVLVGTKKALAIAVKNVKTEERYSALSHRLAGRV